MKKLLLFVGIIAAAALLSGCTTNSQSSGYCGNGICDENFPIGETHAGCPQDCKVLTQTDIRMTDQALIKQAGDSNDYLLCEQVVTLKDRCFGTMWKNWACNMFEENKRNDCYYKIAESLVGLPENVVNYEYNLGGAERSNPCAHLSSTQKSKDCYNLFGIDIGADLNKCIGDSVGQSIETKYNCYIGYAIRSKDISICNNIDENYVGPVDRWQCEWQEKQYLTN